MAVAESELPRFPKAHRWERDPDLDTRVAKLKTVRDAAAARLNMDPGVLCARDRLEIIARKNPKAVDEIREIREVRKWQVAVMGREMIAALQTE
jgi:ribonuclease D